MTPFMLNRKASPLIIESPPNRGARSVIRDTPLTSPPSSLPTSGLSPQVRSRVRRSLLRDQPSPPIIESRARSVLRDATPHSEAVPITLHFQP
jgi:hypothetical protein